MIVVERHLVMNPADEPDDKVLISFIEGLRKRTFGWDIRECLNRRELTRHEISNICDPCFLLECKDWWGVDLYIQNVGAHMLESLDALRSSQRLRCAHYGNDVVDLRSFFRGVMSLQPDGLSDFRWAFLLGTPLLGGQLENNIRSTVLRNSIVLYNWMP